MLTPDLPKVPDITYHAQVRVSAVYMLIQRASQVPRFLD